MSVSTSIERRKARIMLESQAQETIGIDVKELIYSAAMSGDLETLQRVVQRGTPIDAIDKKGETALMRAANKNHMNIVRWLLDRGADVNRKDVYGEYPLSYAAMGCHPEMYDFLYSLTDKKLRKRAEKIKQNQLDIGNWPSDG